MDRKRIKIAYKFSALVALCAILLSMQMNTALAEDFVLPKDCVLLNSPQKIDNIITIIEEPLTNADVRGYVTCMRRTCCESKEGNCKGISSEFVPPPKPTNAPPTESTQAEYAAFKKCYSDYTVMGGCQPSTDANTAVSCKRIGIFWGSSGSELLYAYIGAIYRFVASTMGIVCVFIIVWSGFNIATAGDQTQKIEEGKKKIMQSLYGLALLFMSAVILYTINPNFFII